MSTKTLGRLHKNCITKYLKEDDIYSIKNLADALGNVQRLKIIKCVIETPKSITELSNILDLPASNVMFHSRILEDAKLIKFTITNRTTFISMLTNDVIFKLDEMPQKDITHIHNEYDYEIKIGNYLGIDFFGSKHIIANTKYEKIDIEHNNIFTSKRFDLELLGLASSIVTYPLEPIKEDEYLTQLHISLEICSEAPYYRNDFISDIEFFIDDVFICEYRLKGDYGGRKGLLNPSWYPLSNTQYGELLHIDISKLGVTINGFLVNDKINIDNIDLSGDKIHTLKFGNNFKKGTRGGMNIFGKCFGDHPQHINIKYIKIKKYE